MCEANRPLASSQKARTSTYVQASPLDRWALLPANEDSDSSRTEPKGRVKGMSEVLASTLPHSSPPLQPRLDAPGPRLAGEQAKKDIVLTTALGGTRMLE